jgi:hypothetical protein
MISSQFFSQSFHPISPAGRHDDVQPLCCKLASELCAKS